LNDYDATELSIGEGELAAIVSGLGRDLSGLRNQVTQTLTSLKRYGGDACQSLPRLYPFAAALAEAAKSLVVAAQSGVVGGVIKSEQQAMAALPGPYSAYWQAQHALPSYYPTPPIPSLRVALADGQAIINGLVSRVNSEIDQENADAARAYGLVNTTNEEHDCGPPKSAPVIGHVTATMLGA